MKKKCHFQGTDESVNFVVDKSRSGEFKCGFLRGLLGLGRGKCMCVYMCSPH